MKLLLVIDMQNDFIDGSLGTKEAVSIVDNVKKKIAEYRNSSDMVIYTRDTHYENYLETQEGKNLPVEHCIKDTFGWQISSAFDTDGCEIIDKPTFGSKQLAYRLEEINPEEIELVGLCTDICVISNALIAKATLPEIRISVDASCCAGVTPESHLNALNAMKMCQIVVTNE